MQKKSGKVSYFWLWFTEEGRTRFTNLYKVAYDQTNNDHKEKITEMYKVGSTFRFSCMVSQQGSNRHFALLKVYSSIYFAMNQYVTTIIANGVHRAIVLLMAQFCILNILGKI